MDKHITLIVKVTNACNMRCRYCFIEPSVYHKTMKVEMARKIVRVFLDSSYFTSVTFIWHGGEPLLRGRTFFETILAEQDSRATNVRYLNAVQTNATHLDHEMFDLLVRNDFRIGLSLDGPQDMNDKTRSFPNVGISSPQLVTGGNGARPTRSAEIATASAGLESINAVSKARSPYQITVDAANRLRAKGLPAGAIVVVSAANVDHPEEIYWEFKRDQIHMKVNPLMRSGLAAIESLDLGILPEQYGQFLVRLFDVWYDDPHPTIGIDPLEKHIARILGMPGAVHECHFAKSCHRSFIGIAPDGDMYPCGMFQGEPGFRYGNINDLAPEDIPLTVLFGRINERERKVLDGCRRCAFFDLCYGGCMFHSLKNANRFEEKDYYCAGYKMYFEHLVRRIHADVIRAAQKLESEKIVAQGGGDARA